MLSETPVKVGDVAVQPADDHVRHVRVEHHRVPKPAAAAARLDELRPPAPHHGAEQAARAQRRRREVVRRRRRPDRHGAQRPVGGRRRSVEIGAQLDLDFDGPRRRVQHRQLYTTHDRPRDARDTCLKLLKL